MANLVLSWHQNPYIYPDGQDIYNFDREFYGLLNMSSVFYSVQAEVKKNICEYHIYYYIIQYDQNLSHHGNRTPFSRVTILVEVFIVCLIMALFLLSSFLCLYLLKIKSNSLVYCLV